MIFRTNMKAYGNGSVKEFVVLVILYAVSGTHSFFHRVFSWWYKRLSIQLFVQSKIDSIDIKKLFMFNIVNVYTIYIL